MGKLNEVTLVTTLSNTEYINVMLTDGTIGKIKKSDLIPIISTFKGSVKNFDFIEDCRFYVNNRNGNVLGAPDVGFYFVLTFVINENAAYIIQFAYNHDNGKLYIRRKVDENWMSWKSISLT